MQHFGGERLHPRAADAGESEGSSSGSLRSESWIDEGHAPMVGALTGHEGVCGHETAASIPRSL